MTDKIGKIEQVINRVVYNNDKAIEIHYVSCGDPDNSCNYHEEALYMTDKRAFFIAGRGGSETAWRVIRHDTRDVRFAGGQGIRPIAEHEAEEWLNRHQAPEEAYLKMDIPLRNA